MRRWLALCIHMLCACDALIEWSCHARFSAPDLKPTLRAYVDDRWYILPSAASFSAQR